MESIHVSFDDRKITGLEDFNDHDQLRFENEALNPDSVNSDNPNPDTANPDTANPDNVNPDSADSDRINSEVIETVVSAPERSASLQGEQTNVQHTPQEQSEQTTPLSTDSSNPDMSSSDNSDSSVPADSISKSINSGGASESADRDSMNHGGGFNSRDQLPSARKWTKAHTPDFIIGNPEAGVTTRSGTANECLYHSFLSQTEPKKVEEALQDADWVQAMQ